MKTTQWARWALGGGAAAMAGTALLLLLAPRPVSVDVQPVRRGPIAETVSDQGVARVREAYVVSAPVSGRLGRLELHVGDPVAANSTVVARIRPASADLLDPRARAQAQANVTAAGAAVTAAQAQRAQAAAASRKADADLSRVRILTDKGFASRQALDAAVAEAQAARASTQAADAQLNMRRAELTVARAALMGPDAPDAGLVTVTSPASGYVTRVLQEDAKTVQVATPLLEVSDESGLEAQIDFLSQDAVRIREGMRAEIFDWGGAGVLSAVVRRVEPQGFTKVSALGVEEQRVRVLLQLTGASEAAARLGPGYRLWGRVILRQAPDARIAPLGALVRPGGDWAVFRIDHGRARLTPVRIGAMTERDAEVLGGVEAGDRLVVFPSDLVRDGVKVRVR